LWVAFHVADHHVAVEGGEARALQVRVRVDQLLEGVFLVVVLADLVNGLHGVEEVGRRPRVLAGERPPREGARVFVHAADGMDS